MTTEKSEEKAVETTTPSAPEPAKEIETLKGQLAELQNKLTEKETALAQESEKARKHEQAATRNANKLLKEQERLNDISAMKEEIGVMREAVFDLLDSGAPPEEQPMPRRSEQYREKLKTQPKKEDPQFPSGFREKAEEAEELAASVGLDMAKSKELRAARTAFRDFDPDDGLEEVKRVVEAKRQPSKPEVKPVETPKKTELSDKEKEEIAREVMEKKHMLSVDLNAPSGTGGKLTYEMVAKMSPDERWQRRKEIDALPIAYSNELPIVVPKKT